MYAIKINNKPVQAVATAQIAEDFGPAGIAMLSMLAFHALQQKPVDMLVFEKDGAVRSAGYDYRTNELDEETLLAKTKADFPESFWFKLDDYGDKYIGTFLYPHEY